LQRVVIRILPANPDFGFRAGSIILAGSVIEDACWGDALSSGVFLSRPCPRAWTAQRFGLREIPHGMSLLFRI